MLAQLFPFYLLGAIYDLSAWYRAFFIGRAPRSSRMPLSSMRHEASFLLPFKRSSPQPKSICSKVSLSISSRDTLKKMLPRLHLFEIHDQPWCPAVIRDALTDYLAHQERNLRIYKPVLPMILEVAATRSITQVVDLCSGGGGPWIDWLLAGVRQPIQSVILTDKFPNIDTTNKSISAGLTYSSESVDATEVPSQLLGFRTLFTSFHHFKQDAARSILRDACQNGQPIGVFEFTHRTIPALLLMLAAIVPVWIAVAQMRPVKFSRIFLTYLVPVIPFVVTFDGFVSCLRTYSPSELLTMVNGAEFSGFEWKAGLKKGSTFGFPITYLIGFQPTKQTGS